MPRAVRLSFVLLAIVSSGAGCAEDTALAGRVQAIRARRAAEFPGKEARIELGLVGGGSTWCPSSLPASQLRATVHANGVLTPVGAPGAGAPATNGTYVPREALEVSISTGTIGPDWSLVGPSTPGELLALVTKPATISAQLARRPTVKSTLRLETSFDCDQAVEFAGRTGRAGGKGGIKGEDGEDGLNVVVGVAYLRPSADKKLVLVKATPSAGAPMYFVLPPGRRVGINVRGGDGGTGGDGTVSGVEFSGGLGGDGGNGGRVAVHVDGRYPELRAVVTVVNPGGKGGRAGAGADAKASEGRSGRPGAPPRVLSDDPDKVFAEEIEAGLPLLRSQKPDTQI